MAEVLCVYREVKLIRETAAAAKQKPSDAVAIVSYDEKPGIQAIATTAPDRPPAPGRHATLARDHEYKRHGAAWASSSRNVGWASEISAFARSVEDSPLRFAAPNSVTT